MLRSVGIIISWGLLASGVPTSLGLGENVIVLTGGGRVPTPSELLIETLRMDQARQLQWWQTRKFEAELQCRQYPEKCLPLIEVKPRPRPDIDLGEGLITIEGAPSGSPNIQPK